MSESEEKIDKVGRFEPSVEQQNLLQTLINSEEHLTVTELCEQAGVPRSTYYHWQQNEHFVTWFKDAYDKATAQYIARIKKNLYTKALAPGAKKEDIELALRVHGSYVPEQKHTVENINYSEEIDEIKKLAKELSKIEVTPDGISERTENITG